MAASEQKFALAFQESVAKDFNFLLQLGFIATVQGDLRWIFESSYLRVSVERDWGEQVSVSLEPIMNVPTALPYEESAALKKIGLEIIVWLDPNNDYSPLPCHHPQELKNEIRKAAQTLQKYCKPLLLGDLREWPKYQERVRELLKSAYEQEEKENKFFAKQRDEAQLRKIRFEAEEAFKAKNYKRVIELYSSIAELAPSEAKKMEYAEKKLLSNC